MTIPALLSLRLLKIGVVSVLLVAGIVTLILLTGCGSSTAPAGGATPSRLSETTSPTATTGAATPVPAHTSPPAETSPPSATPEPSPPTAAAFVGSAAPDFPFKLFQGEETLGASELNLSDVTGRPVVLNFWARFCGPCWSEMPELQEFYEDQGDRLQLLGIDVGQFTGLGSPKDAGKLLDALGVTYPAGYTDDAEVVSKFRIRAMPTTVFIDAQGVVFHSWTGAIDRRQLDSIVAEMLK